MTKNRNVSVRHVHTSVEPLQHNWVSGICKKCSNGKNSKCKCNMEFVLFPQKFVLAQYEQKPRSWLSSEAGVSLCNLSRSSRGKLVGIGLLDGQVVWTPLLKWHLPICVPNRNHPPGAADVGVAWLTSAPSGGREKGTQWQPAANNGQPAGADTSNRGKAANCGRGSR